MNKLLLLGFLCLPVFAADELTTFFDNQLKSAENDVVALAAAMLALDDSLDDVKTGP